MSCCVGISIPRLKVCADHKKEKLLIDYIRSDNFEDFSNLFEIFIWNRKFLRSCVQLCVEKCQWRFLDTFLRSTVEHSTDRKYLSPDQEQRLSVMMEECNTTSFHLSGDRLLFLAAESGETQIVDYLMSAGCSPNITFKTDEYPSRASALHAALISGHEQSVKYMLRQKCTDHSLPYGEDKSVLHLVCEMHSHELLESVMDHVSDLLEHRDAYSRTPLQQAAVSGCIQCVQQLLTAGADVNARALRGDEHAVSIDSVTPLMLATAHQRVAVTRCLLAHPRCDVNATDTASWMTALHRAADVGNVTLVTLLLEHHANPNPVDMDGATPLSLAVNERHVDAALTLLSRIGDPDPTGLISLMAEARGLVTLVVGLGNLSESNGPNRSLFVGSKPVTLKHMSKLVVRRSLRVIHQDNTSMLGIPNNLIEYLYQIF